MGSLIKDHLSKKWQLAPKSIYHLTLMPCFDKKLEASRDDFTDKETDIKDVDCVITTLEIEEMLTKENCDLATVGNVALDTIVEGGENRILSNIGSASGGYSDLLFR